MEFLNETRVTRRHDRLRVDQFLARRFGYLSRTEWQGEIRRGKISINDSVINRPDKGIRAGDCITYSGRDAAEPEVNTGFSVIYEDDLFLAVDKPPNLPVHPAGVFYHNTLLSLIQKQYESKFHILNRLDRDTSGVVLLAKSGEAAAWFRGNYSSVRKTYLALVDGKPERSHFVVDVPVDADPASGVEHRRAAFPGARWTARTEFTLLLSGGQYSLLKAVPVTGRQHQIRVHCLHAGYPIVGDRLYGTGIIAQAMGTGRGREGKFKPIPLVSRSALHSRSLQFRHPMSGRWVCLKADMPDDMRQLIDGRHHSHG